MSVCHNFSLLDNNTCDTLARARHSNQMLAGSFGPFPPSLTKTLAPAGWSGQRSGKTLYLSLYNVRKSFD